MRFPVALTDAFTAVSAAQWLIGGVAIVLLSAEKILLPVGAVQNALVSSTISISNLLLVIYRKPSDKGGTVTTARLMRKSASTK